MRLDYSTCFKMGTLDSIPGSVVKYKSVNPTLPHTKAERNSGDKTNIEFYRHNKLKQI